MPFEDTLNEIAGAPLNDCFLCLKLKQTINEPGMPNQLYEMVKNAFLKTVGWFAELISKLYKLIKGSVDYIIENGTSILTNIFNELKKFTLETKDWIVQKLSSCYENIKTPIPAFDFPFMGMFIPMPSNTAYNNLEEGSPYKKPQWLNQVFVVIRFIVEMLTLPLEFIFKVVGWIYSIIEEFIEVLTEAYDDMLTLVPVVVDKVKAFFEKMKDLMGSFVESALGPIIGFFEESAEKIAEYVSMFFEWIKNCIASGISSIEEAISSLDDLVDGYNFDDNKLVIKLKMIGKFIFCIITGLFKIVKTLFTFGWV